MVNRLAEPVDVHVVHGALTFKRFARTALLHLFPLLGCLFGPFGGYYARISLQHWWVIIVLSVPPTRPGRPFGFVGAGWSNRPNWVGSCWHWLLQFELEQLLFRLSMLFSFWATLYPTTVNRVGAGKHWEISVLNVSSLERCSAFGESSTTATMLPIHRISSYRTSLRVSPLQQFPISNTCALARAPSIPSRAGASFHLWSFHCPAIGLTRPESLLKLIPRDASIRIQIQSTNNCHALSRWCNIVMFA